MMCCELKQQYPYYQEIFTDGSKSTNQVCAATIFLSSKLAFSTKLPHTTSIFTAELLAIQLALSNIHKHIITFIFCSLICNLRYMQLITTPPKIP